MLPPLPRCSSWAYSSLISPGRISLPRKGCRVGLHIVLFEACSAFTRVAACTLARSPIRDPLPEGFSHFVTSMTAPVASGWSGCRVGLAPTGKRRLVTAHTLSGPSLQSATMASGAPLPALPDRQARRRGAGKRLSQTAGSETQQFLSFCDGTPRITIYLFLGKDVLGPFRFD